jgi:hypothetical protein
LDTRVDAPDRKENKENARRARVLAALAGAAVGLLAFFAYLNTLAPGVLYYDRPALLDPVMLQTQAYSLGITHPTGYPTWIMITHLFTQIPFGSPAYLANFASAVWATAAVVFVYLICLRLGGRVVPAAVGALAFAVGETFWNQAVIAEVYTMNAMFVAATVYVLLLWRDSGRDAYLLLAAFLTGLSLTHHLTSGLLLPAGLLFVWLVDRAKPRQWGLMLKAAGLFCVALTPYLYLPVRAAMRPELMEADPSASFGSFFEFATGTKLTSTIVSLWPGVIASEIGVYAGYLTANLHWVFVLLAASGIGAMLARDRAAALLTGTLFAGWVAYALIYNIHNIYIYFIPTYAMLSVWLSYGLREWLGAVRSLAARFPADFLGGLGKTVMVLISAVALLLPLAGAADTYASVDRSQDDEGRRVIETVAEEAEPGATIIHHRSALWYMVVVEERRRDLTLVDPFYAAWNEHHDTVWPGFVEPAEADARYGTDDYSGMESAKLAAERGPVYILDHEEFFDAEEFRNSGFEVTGVGEDLYRLVPPESPLRPAP